MSRWSARRFEKSARPFEKSAHRCEKNDRHNAKVARRSAKVGRRSAKSAHPGAKAGRPSAKIAQRAKTTGGPSRTVQASARRQDQYGRSRIAVKCGLRAHSTDHADRTSPGLAGRTGREDRRARLTLAGRQTKTGLSTKAGAATLDEENRTAETSARAANGDFHLSPKEIHRAGRRALAVFRPSPIPSASETSEP